MNTHSPLARRALATLTLIFAVLCVANSVQGSSGTVVAGQSVTLSVTAAGTAPFTYQWYKDSAIISGATAAAYSIGSVRTTDAGNYYSVVSNSAGSATSDTAVLLVTEATAAPAITTQPSSQTVVSGGSVTFTAAVSGTPAPAFQWQLNGVNIAGATSASYTIASATAGDCGTYILVATNSAGSVKSSGAVLLVAINTKQGGNTTVVITKPLTVTTLAGAALTYGNVDGTGTGARFHYPTGVAVDNAGNLYVADTDNDTIRKVVASTGAVTTLAGFAGASGSADGAGSAARFNSPSAVAVDGAGNVYVADTLNNIVRKVTPEGLVSTLAGTPGVSGSADGTGASAQFAGPQGLAVDNAGNLYVADTNNDTIRKVVLATGKVTTIGGLAGIPGSADGTGITARFNAPSGVTVDTVGNVYVADTDNHTIRQISPLGQVTTLAGLAGSSGYGDGTGTAAQFSAPSSVAVDVSGNVYVADTDNFTIRMVVPATGEVSTIAGQAGTSGSSDGDGSAALFFAPSGIAVDSSNNLLIADTNNHTIRQGLLAAGPAIQNQPQSQTVTAGSSVQFSVLATGHPALAYQWFFNGTAIGGATGTTYSLASAQAADAGNYTVTITNVVGSVTSNPAKLTVNPVATQASTITPVGAAASSGGGGGGGGAPSWWFFAAIFVLFAARKLQGQKKTNERALGNRAS